MAETSPASSEAAAPTSTALKKGALVRLNLAAYQRSL